MSLEATIGQEVFHSHVANYSVSLKPLREFLKQARRKDPGFPVITRDNYPDYAFVDPIITNEKGFANFRSGEVQETPIYDGLVLKLKDYENAALPMDLALGNLIFKTQRSIFEQIVVQAQYDVQMAEDKDAVLSEIELKKLWGRSLDEATVKVAEVLTSRKTHNLNLTTWKIPVDQKEIEVVRVQFANENPQLTGGSNEEITKNTLQTYARLKEFFETLGLEAKKNFINFFIWSPALDLERVTGVIGFHRMSDISLFGALPEMYFSGNTKDWHKARPAFSRSTVTHELAHALNTLRLPEIFNEGLPVLAEIDALLSKNPNATRVETFKLLKNLPDLPLIEQIQLLLDRKFSPVDNLDFRQKYLLPALLLYTLYKENPKICGTVLSKIDELKRSDQKINIKKIIEDSLLKHNSGLKTDDFEKRMNTEIEEAAKWEWPDSKTAKPSGNGQDVSITS